MCRLRNDTQKAGYEIAFQACKKDVVDFGVVRLAVLGHVCCKQWRTSPIYYLFGLILFLH